MVAFLLWCDSGFVVLAVMVLIMKKGNNIYIIHDKILVLMVKL